MGWGGWKNNKILLRPWKKKLLVNKWIELLQRMATFWRKQTLFLEETKQFHESVYRNRKTEDCKTEQLIKRIPQNSRRKSREFGGENYSWRGNMCAKENEECKKPRLWWIHYLFFKSLLEEETRQSGGESNGFDKSEMLPTHTKKGIIICIPKGDKPREYLKTKQKLETYFIVECSV